MMHDHALPLRRTIVATWLTFDDPQIPLPLPVLASWAETDVPQDGYRRVVIAPGDGRAYHLVTAATFEDLGGGSA